MKKRILALIATTLLSVGAAHASFTGDYASSNWITAVTDGGNGTAVVSADASTLTLTSSDYGDFTSLISSDVSTAIKLTKGVTLSFDWSYLTNDEDGSTRDAFGYAVDGAFVQLSADGSFDNQSGNVVLTLKSGQTFAFVSKSTDSIWGSSVTTVSKFSGATPTVPEPESISLALAGLGVAVVVARRRAAR